MTELTSYTCEQVKDLIIIEDQQFLTLNKNIETKFYGGIAFILKGPYIAKSSARKISFFKNKVDKVVQPPELGLKEGVPVIKIPSNANNLYNRLRERFASPETRRLIFCGNCINVYHWLPLFSLYTEFSNYYNEYLLMKDENAILYSGSPQGDDVVDVSLDVLPRDATKSDIRATIYMIYIFMHEQPNANVNLHKFIRIQLKVINAVLKTVDSQLLLTPESLMTLASAIDALPKLKTQLFWFCNNFCSQYKELKVAKCLLVNSTMTTVYEILRFINAEIKSEAHNDLVMLEEIKDFLKSILEMKRRTAALWVYWRFLHPENPINLSSYPNLAIGTIYYKRNLCPASYKNYILKQSMVTIPNLKQKAETFHLFDTFGVEYVEVQTIKDTAKQLLLDLSLALTKQSRDSEETNVNDDLINQFAILSAVENPLNIEEQSGRFTIPNLYRL